MAVENHIALPGRIRGKIDDLARVADYGDTRERELFLDHGGRERHFPGSCPYSSALNRTRDS